jgi:hypothetical protein
MKHQGVDIMTAKSGALGLLLPLVGLLATEPASATVTDVGSLTAGTSLSVCPAGGYNIVSGFGAAGLGAYSPVALTGGQTVTDVINVIASCTSGSVSGYITVSGFSQNPGSAWLTTIQCGQIPFMGSSAVYSYSGGSATWTWNLDLIIISSVSPVTCAITHD